MARPLDGKPSTKKPSNIGAVLHILPERHTANRCNRLLLDSLGSKRPQQLNQNTALVGDHVMRLLGFAIGFRGFVCEQSTNTAMLNIANSASYILFILIANLARIEVENM